jgi:uncharacterized LabA/DUF88 family protein
MDTDKNLAVLIDAENVSSKYIRAILDEISKYGTPTYKRIYGDWSSPHLTSWKNTLLEYSIIPVQQYQYTTGKNATDSALIIDAMDILYSGNVDGFCLVSSDSDFTRLAARLRESGRLVIGFGEKKTPSAFISSCNKFVYIEVLLLPEGAEANGHSEQEPDAKSDLFSNKNDIVQSLVSILKDLGDDQGWAYLGTVGGILSKRHPDFDSRNYNSRNLTEFVRKLKKFEVDIRATSNPRIKHTYIRVK